MSYSRQLADVDQTTSGAATFADAETAETSQDNPLARPAWQPGAISNAWTPLTDC